MSHEPHSDNEYFGNVINFTFSESDNDSSLTVLYHGMRVHIDISLKRLAQSPSVSCQYKEYLDIANQPNNTGDRTIEDFFLWILRECAPQLSKLPLPVTPSNSNTASLNGYINAPTQHFKLCANQRNELELELIENARRSPKFGVRIAEHLASPWLSFKPSDVTICAESYEEAISSVPGRVRVSGSDSMFFKLYRFCDSKLAERELEAYKKISLASLPDSRISRLHGLVQENGRLYGLLLMPYIEATPLSHVFMHGTSEFTRQKWADQITSTMSQLHEAGILWGDVKSDNVLIDTSQDAWIIDFGGGNTDGWVDPELAGTKEGDLQGLHKIIEFLLGVPEATG